MAGRLFNRPGTPKHEFPTQLQSGPSSAAVPGSEYIWGTHAAALANAEGLKGFIWASVAAHVVVASAIGTFVYAPQQAYADVQPDIQNSLVSRTTGRVLPFLFASPQQLDLTQQAAFSRPTPNRQGQVPPQTQGQPQTDPSQLAPSLWASQLAATITPNPISGFFFVPGQDENRQFSSIWANQITGQTPPVITSLWAAPQQIDLTQQAQFTQPALAPVVIVTGPTVWPTTPVPPQFDISSNGSAVWTQSTLSPSSPPQVVVITQAGGSGKTKYHWEVEQERQRSQNELPANLQTDFDQGETGVNPSLLAARVELEKARRELETRRNIEKAKGIRKSLKRQGTEPVFADRQAEEAKKLDEEAMLLILLADD